MTRSKHQWQPVDSGLSDTWLDICARCGAQRTLTVDQDGETTERYVPPEDRPACGDEEDENGADSPLGGDTP